MAAHGPGVSAVKDGSGDAVERELLASRICRCFDVSQVIYEEDFFDGQKVTVSDNITSKEYSIASMEAFTVFSKTVERMWQNLF